MKRILINIIVVLYLIPLLSCGENESTTPSKTNGKVGVSIISIPNAEEGTPNTEYTFTAVFSNKPDSYRLDWYFDDAVLPISLENETSVKHTFLEEGRYFVKLLVHNNDLKKIVAEALLTVNIRSSYPQISMVKVPAGTYFMGKDNENFESPRRSVKVTLPFFVGKTEIMQSEWFRLMGYNPSWFKGDSLPVENITWYEALKFCNSLSIREEKNPCYTFITTDSVICDFSKNGYRLPTEMEWEYAARAGSNDDTQFGNVSSTIDGCYPVDQSIDKCGWYCGNTFFKPSAVAKKLPNLFGLYDVIGNVQEWCWDWYDPYYYNQLENIDAKGPTNGTQKVCRGGSWYDQVFRIRLSGRLFYRPSNKSNTIGFRVVRRAD